MLCATAAPACAELGFTVSAASDDRFRGSSTSDGLPVATVALSYDDADGPYAGLSFTAGPTRHHGLQMLRSIQYAGYARPMGGGVSIDLGLTNRLYSRFATIEYARRLTQGYVGIVGRRASTHLFFAPDADGHGGASGYLESDAMLWEHEHWSLTGHLGGALRLRQERRDRRYVVDARLGLTRRLGRGTIGVSAVGVSPDAEAQPWRGALVVMISRSF